MHMPITRRQCYLLACSVLAAGCSSERPPVDALSAADLAVRQAEASKAPQSAPLDLRLAHEKLSSARQAMDKDDYEKARRMAEEALVDAQLAQAKAESESARKNADELRSSIEALSREAQRAPATPPPSPQTTSPL
jgi:hypothetical protein